MSWLDTAIEQANNPITVGVSDLNIGIDELQFIPLSASEFQILKSDPQINKLSGEDKNEMLGLRSIFEMCKKCDKSLSWGKWQQLPLQTLGTLATRITESIGSPSGGGSLGKL